jgi:Ca-activated chloride channel family protein
MSFQAPLLLALLAVVPLVAVVYALSQRRARKFAVRYTNVDLLIAVAGRSWARHVPAVLALLALAALLVALARPQRTVAAERREATVMLVFDTSGSMGEENKIEQAKDGLRVFFRELSPRDRVGLLSFNTKIFKEAPIAEVGSNLPLLRRRVTGLLPDGETAVYDATAAGFDAVRALHDDSRINAVVVLTDGQDNPSHAGPSDLVKRLAAQSQSEQQVVRVFTIAYGKDPDRTTLASIAKASGGEEFSGDPTEIEAVYRTISSFF